MKKQIKTDQINAQPEFAPNFSMQFKVISEIH